MKFLISTMLLILLLNNTSDYSKVKQSVKYEKQYFEQYLKNAQTSLQVYFYVKKYTKIEDMSERVAFRVLRLETGYRGPFHFEYNKKQTSIANAQGPMQLLVSTANYVFADFDNTLSYDMIITKEDLLRDTELNIRLGIRYLKYLNNRFNSWKYATGYYNTGYKRINSYARYASG